MNWKTIALLASMWPLTSAFAGDHPRNPLQAKPIIDDGIERLSPSSHGRYIPGLDKAMLLNWVAVDSMGNAFGPALNKVMPIVYDPGTDILAVIHRGASPYAVSSGQLWYNISRNGGLAWRRVGELNHGAPYSSLYPSATIVNPNGSADTGQCLFAYVANSFDGFDLEIIFGVDWPLGAGAPSAFVIPGSHVAGATIWTQPATSLTFWAAFDGTNHWLGPTYQIPLPWHGVPPYFLSSLGLVVGKGTHTASYYAAQGLFYPDSEARAFNAGYSKSTDNGATWSGWFRPSPDWMAATGLPPHYDLYDYFQPPGGTVSYLSDMLVDANEHVHFFHVVVDSPWTNLAQRGILEVYETGTGWAYKWVTQSLNPRTALGYPGPDYLNQTGNAIHASITADGDIMTIVWLDANTPAATDTLPDIWFSMRSIAGSSWSPPVNLTQTPSFAELLLHAAPILKRTGSGITVFLGRSYQCNINTYPPDNTMKTTFFAASFTAPIVDVVGNTESPRFTLEQNYPNPFNPATEVRFRTEDLGFLSLKVYDLLGREVATLVNEHKPPGQYRVTWDARNMASGIYYYRLVAGRFSQIRKMLLVK